MLRLVDGSGKERELDCLISATVLVLSGISVLFQVNAEVWCYLQYSSKQWPATHELMQSIPKPEKIQYQSQSVSTSRVLWPPARLQLYRNNKPFISFGGVQGQSVFAAG